MKYSYNIVEAAALWAGVEFSHIRASMDAADRSAIEAKYEEDKRAAFVDDFEAEETWHQQRTACAQCEKAASCPEWDVVRLDGDEVARLKCPEGFQTRPADEPPSPRVVQKREWKQRLLPRLAEFKEMPAFEERLDWLRTALSRGDLQGKSESVLAYDLRVWMEKHFPGQRPKFLFPSEAPALQIKEAERPDSALLPEQKAQDARNPFNEAGGLTKREQQIRAIEEMADRLGYLRQQIPDGGKEEIRKQCHSQYPNLFGGGEHPFNDAWKVASKSNRVVMLNRNKFAGR